MNPNDEFRELKPGERVTISDGTHVLRSPSNPGYFTLDRPACAMTLSTDEIHALALVAGLDVRRDPD